MSLRQRALVAGALWLAGAVPAGAVRPEPHHRSDAKRFALDVPEGETGDPGRSRRAGRAVAEFNALNRGRFSLGGYGARAADGRPLPPPPEAKRLAEQFLRANRDWLGIDPLELQLELARSDQGTHHLLFVQVHDGVPVEFSRVKVHLAESGELISFTSNYRARIDASPIPALGELEAAAAVARDLGGGASPLGGGAVPAGGRLVYYPHRGGSGPPAGLRLAWRFRAAGGAWVYYVDARTGDILFRYNDLRFQACQSSGTVTGEVFDVDPNATPGPSLRPMRHERVFVVNAANSVLTQGDGKFCSPTAGKIFTSLQGPFVSVAHFNGPSAHYDNAAGSWLISSSPVSSPHPYPDDAVLISTINILDSRAVKVLPNFITFEVGDINPDGDLVDNDQVAILDSAGNPVAHYIGNRGQFRGAAVSGAQLRLRLTSNKAGSRRGFDVNISSYLILNNAPSTPDNTTSSFTWRSIQTFDGTRDEINLFYQLNLMHDYFMGGVDKSSAAFIDFPVAVMARIGPNLANAYYDPVHRYLGFGDVANGFAFDGTVVRHEYVHFMVDQIYPVLNFGQHGAVSEALADYFSASSLGISSIGKFTGAAFGGEAALRELDCPARTACKIYPTNWAGEIHDDSQIVSQALWEIRGQLIANLGAANGQACADGMVFQSLLFFPDSLQEMLEAMMQVSGLSGTKVPACGANNSQNGLIEQRFSVHGIARAPADNDPYEPNDGIQTATDIATQSVVSARIFPNADQDYYALGAGPGRLRAVLALPPHPTVSGAYFAYGLTLLDRKFEIVTTANPEIENPTINGFCPNTDCRTSSPQVVLEHDVGSANQFYLLVAAAPSDNASNSGTFATRFYSLSASFNRTGPVTAGIVGASFDNDRINFSVLVSSFARQQNFAFSHAQLRDHALTALPGTATNGASPFLTFVSSAGAGGLISGTVAMAAGFANRFPAVGSVHLEVFGVNPLGHGQSLGMSPALHLTADKTSLTAWNNVFNPLKGEKATFKYEIREAGNVRLRLFTLSGNHVATLIDEFRPAGKGAVDWYGANLSGVRVASGIYFLHLEAPGITKTQKVVVVK